jgi:hypothetical protein
MKRVINVLYDIISSVLCYKHIWITASETLTKNVNTFNIIIVTNSYYNST